MALTAKEEVREWVDQRKEELREAMARDAYRQGRFREALEDAERAVQERMAVLPCPRFGRMPPAVNGLSSYIPEPPGEVCHGDFRSWIQMSAEVADAKLEAALARIDRSREETERTVDQLAACAKCRVFFRCAVLTWLSRQ